MDAKTQALYPDWLRKDFFGYWSELANDNGRKMRFELEKTWNTSRRLATAKRTIYAKDPRWNQSKPVYKRSESNQEYAPIDYSKFKTDDNIGVVRTAGERLKGKWKDS